MCLKALFLDAPPKIILPVSSFSIAAYHTNTQGYQISLPSLNSRGFSLKITTNVYSFFVIRQVNRNFYLEKNYYSRRKLEKLLFEIFLEGGGSALTKEIPGKHRKIKHFADKIKHYTNLRWVNPSPAYVPVVWSSLFARRRGIKLWKLQIKSTYFRVFTSCRPI